MYLEHFCLDEAPFTLTPNVHYFYKLEGHHSAFNVLMLHLRNGEGFIKITGKVGSGKTLLCRVLLDNLGNNFFTAYLPNPDLEPLSLRKALAQELGVEVENCDDLYKLLSAISQRLMFLHSIGKQVVLVIDEAQALPAETLETLRLFTNLETHTTKLLQVVLFGQPELDLRLNQGSLKQLKQRIGFSSKLPLLKFSEIRGYINHRLMVAGYTGKTELFTSSARWLLFYKSKGVPRVINILCHKAMMAAFGKGKKRVGFRAMLSAIKDTESLAKTSWPALLGLLLALAVGITLYYWRI